METEEEGKREDKKVLEQKHDKGIQSTWEGIRCMQRSEQHNGRGDSAIVRCMQDLRVYTYFVCLHCLQTAYLQSMRFLL